MILTLIHGENFNHLHPMSITKRFLSLLTEVHITEQITSFSDTIRNLFRTNPHLGKKKPKKLLSTYCMCNKVEHKPQASIKD